MRKGEQGTFSEAVFRATTMFLLRVYVHQVWAGGADGNPERAKPVPHTCPGCDPDHQLRGLLHLGATPGTGAPQLG